MTIDAAMRTYLQTVTPLTAIVSTKVFPAVAPESTVCPYVTYAEIGVNEAENNEAEGYNKYYQLTVYSKTYSQARDIVEILETAFFHRPNVGYSGVRIIGGALSGSRDLPFDPVSGVYSVAVDIIVKYVKTA